MRHRIIDTFTGPFVIIQHEDGRLETSWMNAQTRLMLSSSRHDAKLAPALAKRLVAYFDGKNVDFFDVANPEGADFFVRCWDACRRIPRGQTRSYAELASMAGSTTAAARAAGQAMRHNSLPIIIPCHRVIGSGGSLHGFGGSSDVAGTELGVKSALLKMEGALRDQTADSPRRTTRPERRLVVAR